MATQQPVAKPTHPEIIKKVEKEIVREAKDEERNLKRAVKDLSQTEKDVKKANKASTVKAEHDLEKSEKQEQTTLKNLFKAENIHDVAVSNVHRAQQNLELSNKHYGKMKETLKTKSTRVDEAMKANDENTKLEKDIKHEQHDEEKQVKHVMNDLKKTEKEEAKVHKAADKAQNVLAKAEKKEEATLNDMYKAQHKHDTAITDLHQAQSNLEFNTQKDQRLKEAIRVKAAQLDQVVKQNEEHTQERNAKINALRGPTATDEAGRIIPQPSQAQDGAAPGSVN
ncbi:hypothetical protein CVT26_010965 [Gymnopilus dilepis]|uniref:Uncharacterized protein n=1 Tax=Gymnopilus dilepis TaxID=231916 RepID=A0A409VJ42_9AGAR|nr:hypothetical protein CVT26_010965 [Gymnopilus dilepis]